MDLLETLELYLKISKDQLESQLKDCLEGGDKQRKLNHKIEVLDDIQCFLDTRKDSFVQRISGLEIDRKETNIRYNTDERKEERFLSVQSL
jgi:hypothetical protein